jgi:predicted XRE-type DNA-binding protein
MRKSHREPEEETKIELAEMVRRAIAREGLSQRSAGIRMGIDQPKVSSLMQGRLVGFSVGRLIRFLTTLGHDIDITIKLKPRNRAQGRIRVQGDGQS